MQKVIELGLPGTHEPMSVGRARAACPTVAGCVLNIVEGPAGPAGSLAPYSTVLETWVESLEDYVAILEEERARGLPPPAAAYQVSERVQKDAWLGAPEVGRTPGAKVIYLVRRRQELSDAEASRLWKAHAPVAREHHVGMARYVQNGVIRALGEDAPVYHGIAVLHFPTFEDFERRMYSSPQGRETVQRDADQLVEESIALICGEFVLKAPP